MNKTLPLLAALLLALNSEGRAQTAPAFLDRASATLATAKAFKWVDWKKAPPAVREAAKLIQVYRSNTLYEMAEEVLADTVHSRPSASIAVIDLNGDGVLGLALWAASYGYCGSEGCMFSLHDNGGMLSLDIADDDVRPAKGGVRSTRNVIIPLERNPHCAYPSLAEVPAVFKP